MNNYITRNHLTIEFEYSKNHFVLRLDFRNQAEDDDRTVTHGWYTLKTRDWQIGLVLASV